MSENESKTIVCPGCQAELELDAEYYAELAGTAIECPECEAEVLIPAAELDPEAAPVKKTLSVRGRSPLGGHRVSGDGVTCPGCGADADADAVICVKCGTNLASGEKHSVGVEKSVPREKMSKGRMIVGVISVLVIIGAGANAYLKVRKNKVVNQSNAILYGTGGSATSHNYAENAELLERLLAENPLATNRQDAVDALSHAKMELEKVPARTEAIRVAIENAQQAETKQEKVAILNKAISANPGATNEQTARNMLENVRRSD